MYVCMHICLKFTCIVSVRFLIASFIVVADFYAANCKLLTHSIADTHIHTFQHT